MQTPAADAFNTLNWKLFFAIVGPIVGGVIAYFGGRWKDRVTANDRRRAIARAQGMETIRINAELGPVPTSRLATVRKAADATPEIHAWIERVIVDGADISATIVTHWIVLQRLLQQLRDARAELTRSLAGDAMIEVTRALEARDDADLRNPFPRLIQMCEEKHRAVANQLERVRDEISHPLRDSVWRRVTGRRRRLVVTVSDLENS